MEDFGNLWQHGRVISVQGEAWRGGDKEELSIGVSIFMYSHESGAKNEK
jgi:hypothetical protein